MSQRATHHTTTTTFFTTASPLRSRACRNSQGAARASLRRLANANRLEYRRCTLLNFRCTFCVIVKVKLSKIRHSFCDRCVLYIKNFDFSLVFHAMSPRKCPVQKPTELRNRVFRHRQSPLVARRVLDRNLDRFFALFELILNQADVVFTDDEFDSIIDRLRRLVVIWSNSLVYRRYYPFQRWNLPFPRAFTRNFCSNFSPHVSWIF